MSYTFIYCDDEHTFIDTPQASESVSRRFATTDTAFKTVYLAVADERARLSAQSAKKFNLVGGKSSTEASARFLNSARVANEWRMGVVATPSVSIDLCGRTAEIYIYIYIYMYMYMYIYVCF